VIGDQAFRDKKETELPKVSIIPAYSLRPKSSEIPQNTLYVPSHPIAPETTGNYSSSTEIQLLPEMVGYLPAPDATLDVFSGNPLEFEYFIEAAEKRIKDPLGCLTRLLNYLRGEAKELVKGCIHLYPTQKDINMQSSCCRVVIVIRLGYSTST